MATASTPEQSAREVLRIMVHHFKVKPGAVVMPQNLVAKWPPRPHSELGEGLEFAIKSGWVVEDAKGFIRLEQAGFDEA